VRKELTLEQCTCGVARKQFWLWRDGNGGLHASHFPPSSGLERSVIAATARDALLPLLGTGVPRHGVHDAEDPSVHWPGRCAATA
jgi:hypothetical protein